MDEAKTYWDIDKLHEWDKNPRSITKEGFERLKYQIGKLGQYKPLLITSDGTVLGGNMRLKAFREMNIKNVWVNIVEPQNENEKLEYALSDNDRAGYYDEDLLANLIPQFNLNWENYAVDLMSPTNLSDLANVENFEPSEYDGQRLDEKKKVKCPNCGHEFET